MKVASRRLTPAEMYPAGDGGLRVMMVGLASGLRVRVVEAGDVDAPPVVLVHGWACSVWMFHDNIHALAESGFRVFAVDLKGHGLSDKPAAASEYTLEAMRAHLIEILDALELDCAGFVGHSMGAALAVHVAAAVPERVSGVALMAPVGFAGVPGLGVVRALTPDALIPLIPFFARRTVVRAMLSVVYGTLRRASEQDVNEFWAPTQFPGFAVALRHLLHEFTWDAPFPDIALPLMMIAGSRDHLSHASDAQLHSPPGRQAQFLVVNDAGHVLMSESPALVNAALADFFRAATRRDYISSQNEKKSIT